jgi:hypothetical protein
MAVNNMSIEQAYTLINAIHKQATGQEDIQATDLSSFISVAQSTLQAGYEPVLNAISQVLIRTIIAVRPYTAKFKGLEVSNDRWGGILRKINFADREAIEDPTYELVEDEAIDQYKVRKPNILETRYVGSDVYLGSYTITTRQLDIAFSNPTEFAAFMSGLMTHFANELEQWLENLKRSILANTIGGNNIIGGNKVVKLLTEYNELTGNSFTKQDVMKPANFKPFMQWVYVRVSEVSRMMTERSQLFQQVVEGKPIMRHTPVEDQRVYMGAKFLDSMDAQVLADTYHDNFLRYADVEAVNYWQSILSPDKVNVTPVYTSNTGKVVTGKAQEVNDIVGIIFDRDAMGYNIAQNSLETSPYNAKGQYYNLFHHVRVQLQADFTEKSVVFLLA